jgi:predicted metalloprotease with PDZ domain
MSALARRVALLAVFALPLAALAQSPGPQMTAPIPTEAMPADTPYAPGAISLNVDLSDVTHRVIQVDETIPVAPGEMTLFYPKWIPGYHEPYGPISKMAGLVITGKKHESIAWRRDFVDVFAFHVTVPEGVKELHVSFQYLQPVRAAEGRFSESDSIIDLEWHTVVLYPSGHFARQIKITPTLKLPSADWHFASALDVAKQDGAVVHFATTSLNTFIDSPLFAGLHYKRLELSPDANDPVFLNLFGDTDAEIALTPEQIQVHKNLAAQAQKLYASHHYRHYDFLYLLSDKVGGVGTEHHESSEDGNPGNYFTDPQANVIYSDLLAHEYTHSWNGKFRRPADLWTPDFNVVPQQGSLLWVYEGMTQYWGFVLAARSGLRTASDTRDLIANYAANFEASPGREWRPLEDTTTQPVISQRAPVSWVSWQRPEDYYTEGLLIWLDADTRIRELSGGKKSLDDFARLFLGRNSTTVVPETYTFDDVVAALNTVQPYDWAGFLHTRIYELAPKPPEDGIVRGGYKLVYTDTEPAWRAYYEKSAPIVSFAYSLGFIVATDGTIGNVWWDSPAFKAGIVPDMHLVAINDKAFSVAQLRQSLLDAEKSSEPIRLTMKRDDNVTVIPIDYHGGLRYPVLERVDGTPDRLDDILAPLQ